MNLGEVSFSLIGATLLWHKHTGSVGACETVYDCLDPPTPTISWPMLLYSKGTFCCPHQCWTKLSSVYPCNIMQVVLIHLCLVTLLVTMVVLASGSDILIFRQCSITIVHVSASSWILETTCIFTGKMKHLFINNMGQVSIYKSSSILVSCTLIQKYAHELSLVFVIVY